MNDKILYFDYVYTPLLFACIEDKENPSIRCIEMLLENGADVNIKTRVIGDTILHLFLGLTKADIDTRVQIVKLFIKYGYDINSVSSVGRTLLHDCAIGHRPSDFLRPLIELGVDVSVKDAHGRNAFNNRLSNVKTWQELLHSGFDLNSRDHDGFTLLMQLAYSRCNIETLLVIIQQGNVNVNAVDKCGRTPLHYVFIGEKDVNLEYVKLLLNAGVHCFVKDKFNKAASQYVPCMSQEQQVKVLCYIFNHHRNLFSRLDFQLPHDQSLMLSRYVNVTKEITELLSNLDDHDTLLSTALKVLNEQNVSDLLCTKGIGPVENVPEFQLAQSQVEIVLERLVTQLSESTPFEFKKHLSGSVSEGCKVGFPDEFDYLFIMKGMDKYFDILPSQTSGYAFIHKKTIEDFPDEFHFFVNEFDDMVPILFYKYFSQKIFEVLQRNNVCEGTDLYWLDSEFEYASIASPSASFLLKFRYHISSFKDIEIDVDIVPAILVFSNDRLKLFNFYRDNFDTKNICVLPTKSYSTGCRVSMSFVETVIILSLPKYIRNAYMLLKILKSFLKMEHQVTTYHLKTALLHTSSKIIKSSINLSKNCGEIKRTTDAANMILQQYLKFTEDKYMPSYFFKINLLEI